MIKIVAKSAYEADKIEEKISKGARYFELHTDKNTDIKANKFDVDLYLTEYDSKIVGIHLPLVEGDAYQLVDIVDASKLSVIEDYINLAQYYSKMNNDGEKVYIIFHNELSVRDLAKSNKIDGVLNVLRGLIQKYPDVCYKIENSMPLKGNQRYAPIVQKCNVGVVNALTKEFGEEYFANLIDICHAKGHLKLYEELGLTDGSHYESLLEWLEDQKNITDSVHLSDAVSLGVSKDTHGQVIDSRAEVFWILAELTRGRKDYNIILEVQEEDYNDSKNFEFMKNRVELALKQISLVKKTADVVDKVTDTVGELKDTTKLMLENIVRGVGFGVDKSEVYSNPYYLIFKDAGKELHGMEPKLSERDAEMMGITAGVHALKFIPEELLTTEVCKEFVTVNGAALMYVPKPLIDRDLCEIAVSSNYKAIENVPGKYKDKGMILKSKTTQANVIMRLFKSEEALNSKEYKKAVELKSKLSTAGLADFDTIIVDMFNLARVWDK